MTAASRDADSKVFGLTTLPPSARELSSLVGSSLLLGGASYREEVLDGCRLLVAEGSSFVAGDEAVICIGAFDGFHLGHRELVNGAVRDARSRGLAAVVVTFDPLPSEFLRGAQGSSRLLPTSDRLRALELSGADAIALLPFDQHLATMSYDDFFLHALMRIVRPVAVHVGSNFHFGYRGTGDVAAIRRLAHGVGIDVCSHGLVRDCGGCVSSTRIRLLLHEGDVWSASHLLSRLHYVTGQVQHGRGEGTAFGFPTANLSVSRLACMPREGVYAALVSCEGRAWPAAVNVGASPTFSSPDPAFLEANLIGFSGNLYGKRISVLFAAWLRASRPFDSTAELERAVLGDIDWVRTHLGDAMVEVRS